MFRNVYSNIFWEKCLLLELWIVFFGLDLLNRLLDGVGLIKIYIYYNMCKNNICSRFGYLFLYNIVDF